MVGKMQVTQKIKDTINPQHTRLQEGKDSYQSNSQCPI